MPKFVIERTIPGVGQMDAARLEALAARSNKVLAGMTGMIQWVTSYAAEDRLFCVYNAESEALMREHARIGGFLCDHVRQVGAIIDPVTGEGT